MSDNLFDEMAYRGNEPVLVSTSGDMAARRYMMPDGSEMIVTQDSHVPDSDVFFKDLVAVYDL